MSAGTLRFDKSLYLEASVKEAMSAFADHAAIVMGEDDGAWTLDVEVQDEGSRRELLGELGNYVLGLTIQAGGVSVRTGDDRPEEN